MRRGILLTILITLATAAGAAAATVASGQYVGTTSQYSGSAKFSLRVARSHVKSTSFQYSAWCQRAATFLDGTENASGSLPIMRQSFSGKWKAKEPLDGGKYTWSVTASISGHFISSHTAKGSLSWGGPVRNAKGQQIDMCRTGRVTWKASHR
jgi:hemolysin activation/secretion protein